MVARLISDWEAKGTTRTAFEEVNLALRADERDSLMAESVFTYPRDSFHAWAYLAQVQRARRNIKRGKTRAGVRREERFVGHGQPERHPSPQVQVLLYGYRPMCARLKYLSPWEFNRYCVFVPLSPPPGKRDQAASSDGWQNAVDATAARTKYPWVGWG